jgi:hypothetical protein
MLRIFSTGGSKRTDTCTHRNELQSIGFELKVENASLLVDFFSIVQILYFRHDMEALRITTGNP